MENTENSKTQQEHDLLARSNKKPKRKITNYIFDRQQMPQDEQMEDAANDETHTNTETIGRINTVEGRTPNAPLLSETC